MSCSRTQHRCCSSGGVSFDYFYMFSSGNNFAQKSGKCLGNFGSWYYEEHLCKIILILGHSLADVFFCFVALRLKSTAMVM